MLIKRRPLINLLTQFGNVPKEWLNHIEPKIVRGPFLPCWVWSGALDRNGYPTFYVEGDMVMAHRYVAKLFYIFPDEWYVTQSCNVRNCLNPTHIVIKETKTRKKA